MTYEEKRAALQEMTDRKEQLAAMADRAGWTTDLGVWFDLKTLYFECKVTGRKLEFDRTLDDPLSQEAIDAFEDLWNAV